MEYKFKTAMFNWNAIGTTAFSVVLFGICVFVLYAIFIGTSHYNAPDNIDPFGAVLALGLMLFMMSHFDKMTRYYLVSEESVVIRRFLGNVTIPVKSVNHIMIAKDGVALLDKRWVRCKRVHSYTYSAFGYTGMFLFRDSAEGGGEEVELYCTQFKNVVLLNTDDGKNYMLSPVDVEGFHDKVAEMMEKKVV